MSTERSPFEAGFFVERTERDPRRSAARGARPQLPKRFYERAEAVADGDGFRVVLDGKPVRTPGGRALVLPVKSLAERIAAEWAGQGASVDPATMPLTRLANSAIDGVARQMLEVEADAVKYAGSDLICYRAGAPEALARAQGAAWDGLVAFAREKLGARLVLAEGVMFAAQPEAALAAMARAVRAHVRGNVGGDQGAPFRLAALHSMTTLTGSLVVALAVALRAMDIDAAWAAAHVDEDFQMAAWGADPEALARREQRFIDIRAAAFLSHSVTETA
jgi:chaperone required for assembly of F1-ATPase